MVKNIPSLEQRITLIEKQLSALQTQLRKTKSPWWHEIVGVFENDPVFDEIVALGREIRENEEKNKRA